MRIKYVVGTIGTILFISFSIYAITHSKYSTRSFQDTLTLKAEEINEIEMSDLTGNDRRTTDPEKISYILDYFDQVKYKRLVNDETAYMPAKAPILYLYGDDWTDFIVPYENEAMISYKVYQVKEGSIDPLMLEKIYHMLPENEE